MLTEASLLNQQPAHLFNNSYSPRGAASLVDCLQALQPSPAQPPATEASIAASCCRCGNNAPALHCKLHLMGCAHAAQL